MPNVSWKINLYGDADAQKIYEELGEQSLTPEEILEKAKDPKSELHKCFEWDDSKAAHQYRLQQARTIMCNLIIVHEDVKEQPRAFYNIITVDDEGAKYHPTTLIMQNPDEYHALLEKAKGELRAFQTKYKMLKELKSIFNDIDAL